MLVRHDLGRGVILTLDQESPGSSPGGATRKPLGLGRRLSSLPPPSPSCIVSRFWFFAPPPAPVSSPSRSLPGDPVLPVLAQLAARRGAPQYLRSDNWPEFIPRRIQRWLTRKGITTAYIDPGKSWQN